MKNLKDKFWSKVIKTSNCWEWGGYKEINGYGRICINRKRYLTHRLSFKLKYGKIPNGLCVLHHCDNPSCVRPDHLFLGTIADNNKDSMLKGRKVHLIGETNGRSKLIKENIPLIRKLYNCGNITQAELGRKFNVCLSTIGYIVNNKTWKHL